MFKFFSKADDKDTRSEQLRQEAAHLVQQKNYQEFEKGLKLYKKAILMGNQNAFNEFKQLLENFGLKAFTVGLAFPTPHDHLQGLNISERHFNAVNLEESHTKAPGS